MTLLVASKVPTSHLNPNRRPIRFEESGIVMLADTRITYRDSPQKEDDARKIWPLAGRAIAGYTGSVLTAEPALAGCYSALQQHRWEQSNTIVLAIKNYLIHFHGKNLAPRQTTVLVGAREVSGRFNMYELSSANGFEIQLRDGVIPRGSGGKTFCQQLPVEIECTTQQWAARARSGFKFVLRDGRPHAVRASPSEKIPVRLVNVATLLVSTADLVVQKAGLKSVGGLTYVRGLNADGIVPFVAKRKSAADGKWYDVTPDDVRTYSEITGLAYEIPPMDEFGQIKPA
ncbi:MAG: hypothetical protein IH786_03840 [Proteobacteria bacterium]|nr:hypothetical protein [Pseudomonadota bacterium]